MSESHGGRVSSDGSYFFGAFLFFGFFFVSPVPNVSVHQLLSDFITESRAPSGSGGGGGWFQGKSLTRVVESGVRGVANGAPPRISLASALLRAVNSGVRGICRAEDRPEDMGRDDMGRDED